MAAWRERRWMIQGHVPGDGGGEAGAQVLYVHWQVPYLGYLRRLRLTEQRQMWTLVDKASRLDKIPSVGLGRLPRAPVSTTLQPGARTITHALCI